VNGSMDNCPFFKVNLATSGLLTALGSAMKLTADDIPQAEAIAVAAERLLYGTAISGFNER
jgi:hypothetical protein